MAKRKEKKATVQAIDTATRRAKVLQLARDRGCSDWRGIAEEVIREFGAECLPKHFDERYAWKDFMRELEAVRNFNLKTALEIRLIEDIRLDHLYQTIQHGIQTEAEREKPDYRIIGQLAGRVLQLMRRRAKMHGLDMPILIRFVDKVDFEKLPDDLLERMASGEDPAVVLSGYLEPGAA